MLLFQNNQLTALRRFLDLAASVVIVIVWLSLFAQSAPVRKQTKPARQHSVFHSTKKPVSSPSALLPTNTVPFTLPWDANTQGNFIMSMTGDRQGHIWVGTEDQGVWRFDRSARAGKQWTQFNSKNGLGDDNCYALTCDRLGRIWAGTLNHGVSVFNGKDWKTYGPLNGPLGSRVFALTTSPKDGDVWMSTEAGLARYSLSKNLWSYYTRAEGLPSDQAQALAFDQHGNLYVGTDCDGIAISSAADDFKNWRVVPGPATLPNTEQGIGLPSGLINALLVTHDGTIYAGTTAGLATSIDGETWLFQRGADWQDKLAGLYHPIAPIVKPSDSKPLLEDYVTSLAEDSKGQIWVGYRTKGYEVFLNNDSRAVPYSKDAIASDYAEALLPLSSGQVLIGKYGGGLSWAEATTAQDNETLNMVTEVRNRPKEVAIYFAPLPLPAKAPTASFLQVMLHHASSTKLSSPISQVIYLGDDWQTQGDWVGRYGRQQAVLWATKAPWNDTFGALNDVSEGSLSGYEVTAQIGPHHSSGDTIRHWISFFQTDNKRVLYNPTLGYRRQAEADDHSEAYPMTMDGTDLWFTVAVPQGLHRVSLYFYNKDGHDNTNRYRDYLIEWKMFIARKQEDDQERQGLSPPRISGSLADLDAAMMEPTLASARVRNFWGGIYKQFDVMGPNKFLIRVAKNGSFNTICSAAFIDPLPESTTLDKEFVGALPYANASIYSPPDPVILQNGNPIKQYIHVSSTLKYAIRLWETSTLSSSLQQAMYSQRLNRIFAYRAVAKDDLAYLTSYPQLPPAQRTDASLLLDNWRWHLQLWQDRDRDDFDRKMQDLYNMRVELASQGESSKKLFDALQAAHRRKN